MEAKGSRVPTAYPHPKIPKVPPPPGAKQIIKKTSVCFCHLSRCGLMHAVVKAARFGRRTEIRHISYVDPRCCDPLISINCLLSAPPYKERLLTSLRQQGVWEREGMVAWLGPCVRYGHDVVMCRVSIGFSCLCTGEVTWNPRTILRYHGGHSSMT